MLNFLCELISFAFFLSQILAECCIFVTFLIAELKCYTCYVVTFVVNVFVKFGEPPVT
jgi:hypothetical protein